MADETTTQTEGAGAAPAPDAATTSAKTASLDEVDGSHSTTFPPNARTASFFACGAVLGMTTVQGIPLRLAA